jgi:hypothetical protein
MGVIMGVLVFQHTVSLHRNHASYYASQPCRTAKKVDQRTFQGCRRWPRNSIGVESKQQSLISYPPRNTPNCIAPTYTILLTPGSSFSRSAISSTSTTSPSLAFLSSSSRRTPHLASYRALPLLHRVSHSTFSPAQLAPTSSTSSISPNSPVTVPTRSKLSSSATGRHMMAMAHSTRMRRRLFLERRWLGIVLWAWVCAMTAMQRSAMPDPPQ